MHVIRAHGVNDALSKGIEHILSNGVEEQSRNGPVLVAPEPVTTVYMRPKERVLFSPTRDANPFFHFFEALWMLNGGNDIEFPCHFNKSYAQYSDDGKTMWDAYGYRWRKFFGWDQLYDIITELRNNPSSRRCVLAMWNSVVPCGDDIESVVPNHPLAQHDEWSDFQAAVNGGKAVPCNTQAYFFIRHGRLNMTVTNRSNDAIFGCYGANAVHFSMLQEYMAVSIGVPVGVYYQVSNNLHVYTEKFSKDKLREIARESAQDLVSPLHEAVGMSEEFSTELPDWMAAARKALRSEAILFAELDPMLDKVATPMLAAWICHKSGMKVNALACASGIADDDWRRACQEWLQRRCL